MKTPPNLEREEGNIQRQEQTSRHKEYTGHDSISMLRQYSRYTMDFRERGVSTSVGMRIGDGMMVSTGVQYMMGPLGDLLKSFSAFDAEDLTASITVGWEW